MDADLLRTFIQVARTRHFRKAAEQLYLTQSAVSARIKLLEERLGTRLFERNKHQVALTTAGVRFLAHAEALMSAWVTACNDVRRPDSASTTIIVGATDTLWNIFLTDWLICCSGDMQDLMLHAELHTGSSLMPALLDGSLDVAVMFDVPNLPRLYVEELGVVPLLMVSDRAGSSSVEALSEGFIDVDWGEAFALCMQEHFGHEISARIHTSVGRVALEVIRQAGGSAYLPQPMVAAALAAGSLYLIDDAPVIERPVYAVSVAGRELDNMMRMAVDLMHTHLQQQSGVMPA